MWVFPNTWTAGTQQRLAMFDGYALEALWVDVEQAGLHVSDVDRDLGACDSYLGKTVGIYSGRWYWAQQGWLGMTKWADQGRDLWDSHYDGVDDVDVNFVPYGGWTQCQIKQFQGSSQVGSVQQVDLNTMRGG